MIKILVMDIDGTLTDGKIYMSDNGELFKAFNIKDGYGIHDILPKIEVIPVVITGRKSDITEKRCIELGIKHIYQGVSDKVKVLKKVVSELEAELSEVVYIGDDLNDMPSMEICGFSACPNDAVNEVKNAVDMVCSKGGGNGAVRELIDYLIFKK